jgi:maltooligosyltrehalose trehalohydrolase
VVATQNHDQIGNRAAGERSAALMSDGRLRVAAALLLTSPFVPMLFQGEEWGASTPFLYFTDHSDPGLGRTVSDGRRHEFSSFGWDPDSVPDPQLLATFERSRLDWAEPRKDSRADLLAWYRRLIALRREIPALADPRLDRTSTEYDQDAGWIVVRRGPVAVASNLGDSTWTFPVDPSAELLAASAPSVERTRQHLTLPPGTVAIVNEGFSHI